jgi:hypothetical protein
MNGWNLDIWLRDILIRVAHMAPKTAEATTSKVLKVIIELRLLNAKVCGVSREIRHLVLTVISDFHLLVALHGI